MVTPAQAEAAARTLAEHVGVPVEELLADMKAGRDLRNAMKAKEDRRLKSRAETYYKRARAGDEVFDEADPRHVGRIEIINGVGPYRELASATIRWNDTGWISERVPLKGLRRSHR